MQREKISLCFLMIFLDLVSVSLVVPIRIKVGATSSSWVEDEVGIITIKTHDFTYLFNKSLGSFISITQGTLEIVGTYEGKKIFNRFLSRDNSTGIFFNVENVHPNMNLTTTICEQTQDFVVFQSVGYLRLPPSYDGSEGKIFVSLTYNVTSYDFVTLNATFESKISNNYSDDLYYMPNARFFWNTPHKYELFGGGAYAVWNDKVIFVGTLMKTYAITGLNASSSAGSVCLTIRHPPLQGKFHITNHESIMSFHLFKARNFRDLWKYRLFCYSEDDSIPSIAEIDKIRNEWKANVLLFFDQWPGTWGNYTPYRKNDFAQAVSYARSLNMKVFIYFNFLHDQSLPFPSDWQYAASGIRYYVHGIPKSFYLMFVNEPYLSFLYNQILTLKQNYEIDGIYFDFYDPRSKNQVSDAYYRMLLVKKLKDLGLEVIAHCTYPYSSPMLLARVYGENFKYWDTGRMGMGRIMSNGTLNIAWLSQLPKNGSMLAYTLTHGVSVHGANGSIYGYIWNEEEWSWVLKVLQVYNQFDADIVKIYPYWNTSYNMNADVTTYKLDDGSYVVVAASLGKGNLQSKLNLTNIISNGNYNTYDLINNKDLGIYPESELTLTIYNNTAAVLRLTPTAQPQIIMHTIVDTITQNLTDEKLTIVASAPSGTTTSIKVFCGNNGKPTVVMINNDKKSRGTAWTYNSSSEILTTDFTHLDSGNGEVILDWTPDPVPPNISRVDHSPDNPQYNESVAVEANISDQQSGVDVVILSYFNSSKWINITMMQESLYTATIPALPYGTIVRYKLYALDYAENWMVTEIRSYYVTDQTEPEVETTSWSPKEPFDNEEVAVSVSVSEPAYASGVKNVTLRFRVESGVWQSIEMMPKNAIWTARIPSQGGDENVEFYIKSYDYAGNYAMTQTYTYKVRIKVAVPSLPPEILAVVGLSVFVLIAVAIYFVKRLHK